MGLNGNDPADVKLAVSLRLKAARYLAGGRDAKGVAVARSVADLAKDPRLVENGIRKNRLEDYEQMKIPPRRMELEQIADALNVPRAFLTDPLDSERPSAQLTRPTAEQALEQLQAATQSMRNLLAQLGRDVGRRDLELRSGRGPSQASPRAAV